MPRRLELVSEKSAQALEKQLKHTRTASQKERLQNIAPALLTLQSYFGEGKRVRYLCQDETRLGLKSETGTTQG
jgi:hypothetical protein